jgi:hypothetical protein
MTWSATPTRPYAVCTLSSWVKCHRMTWRAIPAKSYLGSLGFGFGPGIGNASLTSGPSLRRGCPVLGTSVGVRVGGVIPFNRCCVPGNSAAAAATSHTAAATATATHSATGTATVTAAAAAALLLQRCHYPCRR